MPTDQQPIGLAEQVHALRCLRERVSQDWERMAIDQATASLERLQRLDSEPRNPCDGCPVCIVCGGTGVDVEYGEYGERLGSDWCGSCEAGRSLDEAHEKLERAESIEQAAREAMWTLDAALTEATYSKANIRHAIAELQSALGELSSNPYQLPEQRYGPEVLRGLQRQDKRAKSIEQAARETLESLQSGELYERTALIERLAEALNDE